MARVLRVMILFACLLGAGRVFAAGGGCPSGANYGDPSQPLVTLASLGVTQCYYIAANGSDTLYDGTQETISGSHGPWAHAPGMPNCTGNCATVWNAKPTGVGYILRGGDTWHFGNSSASPYTGGTWDLANGGSSGNIYYVGASGAPIYLGVDKNWYSGSSWARPILNGDNGTSTSNSISTPCSYIISDSANANTMLDILYTKYMIVDNFEMTGMCSSGPVGPTTGSTWNMIYIQYGSMQGPGWFYNLYIHGWTHQQFSAANGNGQTGWGPNNCTANIGICSYVFQGSVNVSAMPHDVLRYVVIDGSDSDPVQMNACYCGAWDVAYSYIGNQSQFITRDMHLFHDNIVTNFYGNGHANVLESIADNPGPSNAYAVYNNVWSNLYTHTGDGLSNVIFWPGPPQGTTLYWFDNLAYNVGVGEFFNGGNYRAPQGRITQFNNTYQMAPGVGNGYSCNQNGVSDPFAISNTHWISDTSSTYVNSPYCTSTQGTVSNEVDMTNAKATSQGYTSSEMFAFSPPSSSSPTIGNGINQQSFCNALSIAASSDPTLSDAAASCMSDTRYACVYNASVNAINCPARETVARSNAWSVGAYQGANQGPVPPTGLVVTVE